MNYFKLIVIVVAIIMLIIVFVYMYFLIRKTEQVGTVYPPVSNQCPDTWAIDGSSNCFIPDISNNLGNLTNFSEIAGYYIDPATGKSGINFSAIDWSSNGMSEECNKKQWANKHNIVWDTISNYNQC